MPIAISRDVALGTLASVLLVASTASATTEVPAQGDARSVALGGTGTAYLHTAAAVFLNPAALDGVEKVSLTAAFSPMWVTTTAPFSPYQSRTSETGIGPYFLVGGALRVHPRITVGLSAYPTSALGATYKEVVPGHDASVAIVGLEISPAVSFRILDNLAIGLSYRISYNSMDLNQPVPVPGAPPGTLGQGETKLSAPNFAGMSAGLYFKPTPNVELGFDYRSKTTSKLSGTSTLSVPPIAGMPASSQSFDATASYSTPHSFRVGSAFTFLDKRLLIAADAKLLLYQDSNRDLTVELTTPVGTQAQVQPQNWRNVVGGAFGVEYAVADVVPLRVGYSITSSATPPATASPFGIAPALVHAIHAGAGVRLRHVNFDAGGFYGFESVDLQNANPAAGGPMPGHYSGRFIMAALSVTYHS